MLHWHAWCRVRRLLTWVHPFWDLEAKDAARQAALKKQRPEWRTRNPSQEIVSV